MRANLAMREGQLEKALTYLEEAYSREPDNPSVLQNMGTVLGSMGRLDEAKGWIERALAATDDPALRRTALLNLADLAMMQGRHADAAAHLHEVLAVDPEDEETLILLADVLEAQKQPSAAAAGDPPQEIPDGPPGVLYRATAAAVEGRWRDARRALERGMAEFPRDAAIALRLAQLLATCPDDDVRDGEQALALVRGVAAATKAPAVLATMAMAMAELGRFDAAINLAETSVKGLREQGRDREADAVEGQLREYREGRPIRLQSPGT
jgi:tetratricopeptide (TPR) repeat protein